jgi:AcrR family transcriptional regulator
MNETSQNKTAKNEEPTAKNSAKGKKRDRCATEAKLLKAAEEIFSKLGFNGATTRVIACKAKVNESLIGRYFEGKMGLLMGVITQYTSEEEHLAELPYPPQETLQAELLGFARFRFERDTKKNFDFFKIVLSQAIIDPKFNKRIRENVPFFEQPRLAERLKSLVENGKTDKNLNIPKLIKELEIFMFGNIISQRIFMGASPEEAFKTLEEFIRNHY